MVLFQPGTLFSHGFIAHTAVTLWYWYGVSVRPSVCPMLQSCRNYCICRLFCTLW